MGGLVVPADEAEATPYHLDVPDVSPRCIVKVLRRNFGAPSRTARRDVHGDKEQGAEARKLLEELMTCGWIESDPAITDVNEVSTSEVIVVHENVQHRVPHANEAVLGKFCKEKVDVVVVKLVTRQLGKLEVKARVNVRESKRDVTLLIGDLLQESPEHVTNVVQTNDHVV